MYNAILIKIRKNFKYFYTENQKLNVFFFVQ